jgi:hypothetical protein
VLRLEKNEHNIYETVCGHYFCKECLSKWIKKDNLCQICRNKFEKEIIKIKDDMVSTMIASLIENNSLNKINNILQEKINCLEKNIKNLERVFNDKYRCNIINNLFVSICVSYLSCAIVNIIVLLFTKKK